MLRTPFRLALVTLALLAPAGPAAAQSAAVLAEIDQGMERYRLDAHIPGMVWGVVKDGRLVHVKGAGVQDVESKRPVTADTLFRIASMTKAFTALSVLKLRDDGKLSLDAPAETYVPELRGWRTPTEDSPKIRVRELITHTAGFVTDDPWGDRQTPLPEDEFTRLLNDGVPFTRPTATAMEYSNLGYALLGRIVANVSGQPYKDFVQRTLLTPLGMTATGYDVARGAGRTPGPRLSLGGRRVEARADDGARRLRRDGRHPDQRHRLRQVGGVPALGVAAARRRRYRSGAALERPRAGARRQLRVGAAAPGRQRRRRLPVGGRLRHGHERGGGLRARAHAEPRRRLSRLRIARAAAARLRRRHLRAGQPHLRRSAQPGVGRRRRSAAGRRATPRPATVSQRARDVPTARSARCGRPARSRPRPTRWP